jgi:hypothetical protein
LNSETVRRARLIAAAPQPNAFNAPVTGFFGCLGFAVIA